MFKIKTAYCNEKDCVLVKRGSGKQVRYDVFSVSEGAICTLNLVGYGKSETVIALKDYSENTGMLAWAKKSGLVKRVIGYVPLAYVDAPLVELDTDVLNKMMQ